jgi:hypothetical protein
LTATTSAGAIIEGIVTDFEEWPPPKFGLEENAKRSQSRFSKEVADETSAVEGVELNDLHHACLGGKYQNKPEQVLERSSG